MNTLVCWTWKQAILGRVVSSNKIVNNIRMPNAFLYRRSVPKIVFLEKRISREALQELAVSLTVNTILPRSPVTFRCLLAISSRNGITTVHPRVAGPHQHILETLINLQHTKSVHNIASQEPCGSENSGSMSFIDQWMV